jgi:hypothetical protein
MQESRALRTASNVAGVTALRTSRLMLAISLAYYAAPLCAQTPRPSFEILTHRMDVDVDGAPNAYGPPGTKTLDELRDAHYRARPGAEIVGYLTDDDNPNIPILQGPHDPYPGLYISQTSFTDPKRTDPRDVSRYVDATKINYIVLGSAARRKGARIGDFVAVYSRRTHKSAFGIVGDEGNPSGNEGSLHLLPPLQPTAPGRRPTLLPHPEIPR